MFSRHVDDLVLSGTCALPHPFCYRSCVVASSEMLPNLRRHGMDKDIGKRARMKVFELLLKRYQHDR
jgi:hypothetical protein